MLDERNSEAVYHLAKRVEGICNASPTAEAAESAVLAEFPGFDLNIMRACSYYCERFGTSWAQRKEAVRNIQPYKGVSHVR